MNTCQFCIETPPERPAIHYRRPKFFNWVTVLLVFLWVSIVFVVLDHSQSNKVPPTAEAMIETLVR